MSTRRSNIHRQVSFIQGLLDVASLLGGILEVRLTLSHEFTVDQERGGNVNVNI